MSQKAKKVDFIFEEPLRLHTTITFSSSSSLSFSSLMLLIPGQNRAKLKKLFNLKSKLKWRVQYPVYTERTYYFVITNYSNASDFLNKK